MNSERIENLQEELVLPLLGPDAVGGGEPLPGHVDHRDLQLCLTLRTQVLTDFAVHMWRMMQSSTVCDGKFSKFEEKWWKI